jgi:hypothetical protein
MSHRSLSFVVLPRSICATRESEQDSNAQTAPAYDMMWVRDQRLLLESAVALGSQQQALTMRRNHKVWVACATAKYKCICEQTTPAELHCVMANQSQAYSVYTAWLRNVSKCRCGGRQSITLQSAQQHITCRTTPDYAASFLLLATPAPVTTPQLVHRTGTDCKCWLN